jgi:hypothetical protein
MGTTTTSQTENSTTDFNDQVAVENISLTVNEHTLFWGTDNEEISILGTTKQMPVEAPDNLDLEQIAYLEADEVIELGFDTKEYLPENFDPTTFYFDLEAVAFIEDYEDADLGFNTRDYLPNNFDAYAQPKDVMDVSYIELIDYDLGIDTTMFLPEGFDPYETELDLNTIVYLEEEIDLEICIEPMVF